jgi:protocatechuate 3,4-dioxygenase beta subunit
MLAVPAVASCAVHADPEDPSPLAAPGGPDPSDPKAAASGDGDSADLFEGDLAVDQQELRACRATTRDAEGPYFTSGSPRRALRIAELTEPGVRLVVEGRLVGPDCRTPLAGYGVDIWQADEGGNYADAGSSGYRLRGKVVSDAYGRYRFETILPGRYGDDAGIRPAHIHAKILTPRGNALLTTQLYFEGDPYLGRADYCTRSGYCNSGDAARVLRLSNATVSGIAGKRARFDAFLART